MAHINCHCGNRITNNYSPSKTVGIVCGEIDKEALNKKIEDTIEGYILSIKLGEETEWLNSYFDNNYPDNPSNVVANIMSDKEYKHHRDIFECNECGSIFIETKPSSGSYNEYSPKSNQYNVILDIPEN